MDTTQAIRCDRKIRDAAAETARYYGLDIASMTRAFWAQVARTNSIPLAFDDEQPNEESLRAIEETEEMLRTGAGESFSNVDALMAALEA
jgi:DNA-damage-inducible protein J